MGRENLTFEDPSMKAQASFNGGREPEKEFVDEDMEGHDEADKTRRDIPGIQMTEDIRKKLFPTAVDEMLDRSEKQLLPPKDTSHIVVDNSDLPETVTNYEGTSETPDPDSEEELAA